MQWAKKLYSECTEREIAAKLRCSKTAVHNAIVKFNAGFMTGKDLVVHGRLRPGKTAQ